MPLWDGSEMKWIGRAASNGERPPSRWRAFAVSLAILLASWGGAVAWCVWGDPHIPPFVDRLVFFTQYASLGAVIGCAATRGRSSGAYWGAVVGFILADLLMLR